MAERHDEVDLDFSDEEDTNKASRPVIAHKTLKTDSPEDKEPESSSIAHKIMRTESPEQKYESVSPAEGENFEAISPVSSASGEGVSEKGVEGISPPESPADNSNKFESISDDDDNDNSNNAISNESEKVIHEQGQADLNINNENSNDSSGKDSIAGQEPAVDKKTAVEEDEEDVEAPVPSPFSDIGDVEDIGSKTDNELISDIMKDSSEADFSLENSNSISDNILDDKIEESNNVNDDGGDNKNELVGDNTTGINVVDSQEGDKDSTELKKQSPAQENENENAEETIASGEASVSMEEENTSGPSQEADDMDTEQNEDDLIANIFGDSDDDEEEFEGFEEEEIGENVPAAKDETEEQKPVDDDESDEDRVPDRSEFVSDFDLMMAKKKAQRAKRKSKKDGYETLGDQDDLISDMIKDMLQCASDDRMANQSGDAATKKLKMLGTVATHLRKADLQHIFIDSGILPAIKEWLTPLPDNALPHVNIRKVLLRILLDLPPVDRMALKKSGIGRAVMLLFKHPKESSENRKVAGKIISNWARPIFNVSTNFQDMSREERESRDKSTLPEAKKRRLSSGAESGKNRLDEDDENRPRKPGDKGWIGRARVPLPSFKDYVNRPESKVDYDISKAAKREMNRYEKQARKMKERKVGGGTGGNRKAVGVSLNGSRLSL